MGKEKSQHARSKRLNPCDDEDGHRVKMNVKNNIK